MKEKERILIVDDKEELIVLVQMILESAGYEVVGVRDSWKAFDMALEIKPSLIILDIMMPQMSGWEVLEKLRICEATAHIPVIFLSVKAEMAIDKCRQFGAVAIMRKPFEGERLIEAVDDILHSNKN